MLVKPIQEVRLKAIRGISAASLRREWFANPKADILAGAVVGLALIPEAIAFSIIAGVDPKVGLYASFIIAITTAFLGGRPGSISAATGAMALLMIDLVKDWGLDYLLVATFLTGIFQVIFWRFETGAADALCAPSGDGGLHQRPGGADFSGPAAPAH